MSQVLVAAWQEIGLPSAMYMDNLKSFNGVWDRNFWQRGDFQTSDHVRAELRYFQSYCRHRRPLAEFDNRTADQLYPDFSTWKSVNYVLILCTFCVDRVQKAHCGRLTRWAVSCYIKHASAVLPSLAMPTGDLYRVGLFI